MVKGKGWSAIAVRTSPCVLLDDMKHQPALRLPTIVPNEGLAREFQLERVDHQGEFGEHQVILAHAEAVHVRGALDRERCDHLLLAVVADAAEPIHALQAEFGDVAVMAARFVS